MIAQELRIGNKIIANGLHGGKIMTVEQIGTKPSLNEGKRVILSQEHPVGEFVEDCEGIPITREVLEKQLGFKRNLRGNYSNGFTCLKEKQNPDKPYDWNYIDGLIPICEADGHDYEGPDEQITTVIGENISFVHELQNLHWALNKTELEVKL